MIYDYHCVDCGMKISGDEISFDLGALISGTNEKGTSLSIGQITKITAKELMRLAKKHNVELKHNHRVNMIVSLREYLEILVKKKGEIEKRGQTLTEELRLISSEDIDGYLKEAVGIIYETAEGQEVEEKEISDYVQRLKSWFSLSVPVEKQILIEEGNGEEGVQRIRAIKKNPQNYIADFWIEPEFFEDGNYSQSLYSIKFSSRQNVAFYTPVRDPLEIRGYCPYCGKPVIKGAGKYPHIMVGMLGAQSAGKTSLIMSMIEELNESFFELGLSFPGEVLCDSKYDIMKKNQILYKKGWAVIKTTAGTDANTFNATYLLADKNKSFAKLVTLIDIAGEQCYDRQTNEVNIDALRAFPLIGSCSIYLLCSCIDQTGYGNADGKTVSIPPEAVVQIANGIYEQRNQNEKVPPMCIVMTKADMARNPSGLTGSDNPLHEIQAASRDYLFASQLEDLRLIYDTCTSSNIRQPLRWAYNTFNQMKGQTYVSLMACSGLGRLANRYEYEIFDQDIPEYIDPETGQPKPFSRKGIINLWKWVLQVSGIIPLENTQYRFTSIPSYIEDYGNGQGKYQINEAVLKMRIGGVVRVFINSSDKDIAILRLINEKERSNAKGPRIPFHNSNNEWQNRLQRLCQSN